MQTLQRQPPRHTPFTRSEFIHMLDYYQDYYQDPSPLEQIKDALKPQTSAYSQPAANIGEVIDEEVIAITRREAIKSKEDAVVEKLVAKLNQPHCSHDAILEAYSALPSLGVTYLSPQTRRLLLRRLSRVENKSPHGLARYLAIVDDMKAANLPMKEAEWNSALAFTGRCHSPVRTVELESALQMWKEMEQTSTSLSGEVTFNILFDLAAKAGKYVLAEMILKEMRARNLPLNRLARTNIIFYHGLQGDGSAVRNAYKSFVEAGEIVDTVVLNCVIASLILAGEPQAAELVYERMKYMYAVATGGSSPPYINWSQSRDLGRVLNQATRDMRAGSQEHRKLQDKQLLCPDLRTYAVFLEYHVMQTGELRRIVALLQDMKILGVPIHGRIFVKLLKGFATHGGVRYTSWTSARLERVWTSLLDMLACKDDERVDDGIHMGKWMVVWAMRAFDQCCGRARAIDIWAELRSRWKPGYDEEMAVLTHLGDIFGDRHGGRERRGGEARNW